MIRIILIPVTTHTGKTALSQRLMEKYKIPYFSIDHLKMGLIRSNRTSLTADDDEKVYSLSLVDWQGNDKDGNRKQTKYHNRRLLYPIRLAKRF